jgi:hypothetical protein
MGLPIWAEVENVFLSFADLPSGLAHEPSINLGCFIDDKGPSGSAETGIALASMQNVAQG